MVEKIGVETKIIYKILSTLKDGEKHVREIAIEGKIGMGIISRYLRKLEKLGLIKGRKEDKFPFREYFSLTSEGKEVLDHLKKIDSLLSKMKE